MKTLNVTAIAQLQNQEHGGCVSDIRKTNATRINLAFCQPDKAFSHNQDPVRTLAAPEPSCELMSNFDEEPRLEFLIQFIASIASRIANYSGGADPIIRRAMKVTVYPKCGSRTLNELLKP